MWRVGEGRGGVGLVINSLPGTDAFEYFVEFLANNVEVGSGAGNCVESWGGEGWV